MECSKSCPVLLGIVETIAKLGDDIERAETLRHLNETAAEQNQATASQLANMPFTPEVAEARSLLQEAIVQVGEAQVQVTNSLELSNYAIEANRTASDLVSSNCPGEPIYIDDPSQPGNMILACASPGVYDA